jgi:hypothetical protein
LKNTYSVPSTNATSAIGTTDTWWTATATTSADTATIRTPSAAIMIRLRLNRSATTPATTPKSAQGTMRAKPTMPACAAECETASTSRG